MMKKNISIKLLALGAVSCLALSAVALNVNVNANADDTTTTTTTTAQEVETFEMANGAAVRVRDDQGGAFSDVTGIRFSMYFNTSYEGLTANGDTATLNTGYEASMTISTADGSESWDYTATELKLVSAADAGTTADVYAFRAVLAGFATENFGTKLTATGSLKQNGTEIGTELVEQTRSVAQVASKALLNPDEVVKDVKGDLKDYVDGVVTTDNFKFEKTALTTDKYKTGTVNEQIGATFPEDLWVDWTIEGDENVVVVDEETDEIAFGDNYGTATLTATLGSASYSTAITYGEPQIFKVTEDTAANVKVGTTVATYSDSSYDDYTGKATKLSVSSLGDKLVYLSVGYTDAELEKIAEDYNTVSMWMAADLDLKEGGTSSFNNYSTYGNTFFGEAKSGNILPSDTVEWIKYSIEISGLSSLIDESRNLALIKGSVGNVSGDICFGDIIFENIEPTILTVTADTASMIKASTSSGTFVFGSQLTFDKNGYNGDATLITHAWNGSTTYSLNNFDSTLFDSYKSKYTHVSLWMAYDHDTTYTPYSTGATVATKGGYGWSSLTSENAKKWFKISVKISDFESLISGTQVSLLKICCDTNDALTNNLHFYFGDIIFETIAE